MQAKEIGRVRNLYQKNPLIKRSLKIAYSVLHNNQKFLSSILEKKD
jgi:hypothetical protein